jgi:epoxyqueuosine reductase
MSCNRNRINEPGDDNNHPNQHIADLIKSEATELGFAACGITRADPVAARNTEHYFQWLDKGHQGKMQYMENNVDKRLDPGILVPDALSVVCLAFNYNQQNFQPDTTRYRISRYAAGEDYHYVLKEKLYHLLHVIQQQVEVKSARVFTDSAPVLERYWAQQAGLGAPGKNSNLIIPRKGSFFFLSEIILDIDLPADKPFEKDMCGKCTRCINACPTGAIVAPRIIDANKCTSYLTIELKEKMPAEMADKRENFIFGCDICQSVCPHNIKFATPCTEPRFKPLEAIATWSDEDWNTMDKSTFKKNFIKIRSPLARPGYDKIMDTIANTR